jgi:hypothetical protein
MGTGVWIWWTILGAGIALVIYRKFTDKKKKK